MEAVESLGKRWRSSSSACAPNPGGSHDASGGRRPGPIPTRPVGGGTSLGAVVASGVNGDSGGDIGGSAQPAGDGSLESHGCDSLRDGAEVVAMTTMMQALMALDDTALEELFRLRPDLASPAPAGFADLAERASRNRSLQAASAGLDHLSGVVLQAACVIDDGATPDAVVALLGGAGRCPPEAVGAALDRLAARAMLWRGDGGAIHPAPALHAAFSYPLGLGRPLAVLAGQGSTTVADLEQALVRLGRPGKQAGERKGDLVARLAEAVGDPVVVGGVLASAPPAVRELADRLAGGRPTLPVQRSYGRAGGSPYEWLVERLLVVPFDWYQAEMPREVGLALRGGEAAVVDLT